MKTQIAILFFLLIICSCKKHHVNEPVKTPPAKEIVSFQLKDSLNTGYLYATVKGVISDSTITLNIPADDNISKLISSFEFKGKGVWINTTQQHSDTTVNDFTKNIVYTVEAEDGSKKNYHISITRYVNTNIKQALPKISINTAGGTGITSKDIYLDATININGQGAYQDYQGSMKIKGRGHTAWDQPQKPYKIKLASKAPLLGLPAAKEWILLANYLDGTLLYNSIPYTTSKLLGMAFTQHIIPVEVTINGMDKGFYVLTEQKEVSTERVNIGANGIWLQLDSYYDEDYKFRSGYYDLPVMVNNPDLSKLNQSEAGNQLANIKNDFEKLEQKIAAPSFPNNGYLDLFDDTAFINYMIVYQLTDNEEINHPKSVYIEKPEGSNKYRMSIVWDFDWAFGFESNYNHFRMNTAGNKLFWTTYPEAGTLFFSRFMQDPHIKSLFKQRWQWFKTNGYPKLVQYVKDYANVVRKVYFKDHGIWGARDSSGNLDTDLKMVLDWLQARVNYLDSYAAGL